MNRAIELQDYPVQPIFMQPGRLPGHHQRYPPGYYPHIQPQQGFYPPDNRQDQNSFCKDLFLAFAAILVIFCCFPMGLCFGIPAIFCIFQAKDEEARGSLGESQRSRLYSLSISAIGCCVGLLLTIVVVTYYALTYEETTQDSTFNNYVL
ncbi:uncharacterized protein [Apostichopus japonicus]|uniref:uncharacterized protein n=1 Tax=Stichopus japonicus TaxID=307972 RepID=UPI003AB69D7E